AIGVYNNPPNGWNDPNALHVNVTGQRFSWSFNCTSGCGVPAILTVPHNKIVILNITSIDVFHSFGIPDLRVKADAIPGKYNLIWFRVSTTETFLQPSQYNEAVTMHGLIMVLWFLSPLGIAFANYFVPHQIGAADVAFARLNATSYWMYVFSGITAFASFFVPGGSPASGWTNYSPLASLQFSPGSGETLGAAALIVLAASNTVGTVNILVTILW